MSSDQDAVVFLGAGTHPAMSPTAIALQDAMRTTPRMVRVRVLHPYRVVLGGRVYLGGDVVSAPEEKTNQWIKAHIVEPVKTRRK